MNFDVMSPLFKPVDRHQSGLIKQIGNRLFSGLRQLSTSSEKETDAWDIQEWQFPYDATVRDQLLFLVKFAVLAPSVLNRQPWRFRIANDRLLLYADTETTLPSFDPKRREITMSCGAALFHVRTAAKHYGFTPLVRSFPSMDEANLLAELAIGPVTAPTTLDEQLFMAIRKRRTHRKPFDALLVEDKAREGLEAAAEKEGAFLSFIDGPQRPVLAKLIGEAQRRLDQDEAYRSEVAKANVAAVGTVEKADGSRLFGDRSEDPEESAMKAPALAVLSTSTDTVPSWFCAGQAVDRLLLTAREFGLFASFMNQPTHFEDTRRSVSELTGKPVAQLILRIGYGSAPPPTPRKPVVAVSE
jgi:nitroreductase